MEKIIFMRANHSPYVRIAKTKDVSKRMKSFRINNPGRSFLLGVIENDDPNTIFEKFKRRFSKDLCSVGFYSISDTDVLNFVAMYNDTFSKTVRQLQEVMREFGISAEEALSGLKNHERKLRPDELTNQVRIFVKTLEGRIMSNGEILKEINQAGLKINRHNLGRCLGDLGYKSKMISFEGLNKRAYYL